MSNLQEASDLSNTMAISARRFEESPFFDRNKKIVHSNNRSMIKFEAADTGLGFING